MHARSATLCCSRLLVHADLDCERRGSGRTNGGGGDRSLIGSPRVVRCSGSALAFARADFACCHGARLWSRCAFCMSLTAAVHAPRNGQESDANKSRQQQRHKSRRAQLRRWRRRRRRRRWLGWWPRAHAPFVCLACFPRNGLKDVDGYVVAASVPGATPLDVIIVAPCCAHVLWVRVLGAEDGIVADGHEEIVHGVPADFLVERVPKRCTFGLRPRLQGPWVYSF